MNRNLIEQLWITVLIVPSRSPNEREQEEEYEEEYEDREDLDLSRDLIFKQSQSTFFQPLLELSIPR